MIAKIMANNGFDPNPNGGNVRNLTWINFLKSHLHLMGCGDFLTKEVWTNRGLVRYLIFFIMDCKTKKVKVMHISNDFYGEKMQIMAMNMTDHFDGFLNGKKYFFCDKDPLYTNKFCSLLEDRGIEVHKVCHPVYNPFAERFVKSIKTECLNNLICFGEDMLKKAVKEYVDYYNTERPHQGIDNELISPENNKFYKHIKATRNSEEALSESKWDIPSEPIVKSERLGGLLNFYYRKTG